MPGRHTDFDDELDSLSAELLREGALAVEQVESAVAAFRACDKAAAKAVRKRDNEVDKAELIIEERAVSLIAKHQPVARDLRRLMVVLKVNTELERIADHATGLCKSVLYLSDTDCGPQWPQSLLEMADRIVPRAHDTLRALQRLDANLARQIIAGDETLDLLGRRAFEEIESSAESTGANRLAPRVAMLAFRASRELERIGDLLGSVCEDIVYMQTGETIRHAKKPPRGERGD